MVTYELLVIIKLITSYELTILATKIIKIGQLGPEIWLFSPYGISAEFSPRSFSWLTHVFTPSIHSWTFLVIMISISTYELTISATKIINIGQLWPELWLLSYHLKSCSYTNRKIAWFQASVDQFSGILWLIWSIHMCWLILWWPETFMSGYRG